mmetsp:Transcript_100563/g.310151  ORF Transcript_100563/g.310151 Transcript_100563/m.310151 type:complete len:114 (-) Transcript_100563:64-405(-)
MSLLLARVRLAARAAQKPSHGARRPAPAAAAQPPAPAPEAPPPPAHPGPADGGYGAGAAPAGGGGGGIGYQLLMIGASIVGTVLAFRLISGIFGPRRITVVHKDEHGNVISRS